MMIFDMMNFRSKSRCNIFDLAFFCCCVVGNNGVGSFDKREIAKTMEVKRER